MGKPRFSLSRSPEESLAIGTAVVAQPAIDATTQVSTNSKASARDIALYTHLVAAISKGLGLRQWAKNWTPIAGKWPNWPITFEIDIHEVQERLHEFPRLHGLPELERSARALAYIVAEAYEFSSNKEKRDVFLLIANQDRYFKESRAWVAARDPLIVEATRVANWFADVVRRDLDPNFLVEKGRFTVRDVPLHGGVDPWVYDGETRPKDLEAVKKRVADIIAPYRALVKERKSENRV